MPSLHAPKVEVTEYRFEETRKMHGVKRVLVFCLVIVILPTALIILPLYLRHTLFADVTYPVAESDIIEIRDGISSIFCQQHTLRMSSHFNAFQLRNKPEISTNHKHIRLKKSMTLPDDTLEYWGFYLLKGARVHLKFCSRYDGSRILVVKGQRELKTCGLLDHNKNKLGVNLAKSHEQVKVFFEDITEITAHAPILESETNDSNMTDISIESENNASEDTSDDSSEELVLGKAPIHETATAKQTITTRKPRRKKLKKGTLNSYREHQEAEKALNSNSLNFSSSELPTGQHLPLNRKKRQSLNVQNHPNLSNIEQENERNIRKNQLFENLYKKRLKRDQLYDRKYSHGGNAVNFTETDESNSVSSFETGLFTCYKGDILLAEGFKSSSDCLSTHFLENGTHRMITKHEVSQDGYYYYIFYSDNDVVRNDIHAIFDIYKPTFQYSNLSDSQGCVNTTNCTFSIGFLSDEIVVVEVPTRDGIEHEEDDITYLISTCHPRTEVYAIFPITVLIIILSFAFI